MKLIELLHPWMKQKAIELVALCKQNGIIIIITQTLRSEAYQNNLYAQGRTRSGKIVTNAKYPQSLHCFGIAFDVCVIIDGKANYSRIDLYKKVGELGKSLGLTWGGDFKSIKDYPHFEAPNHNWRELMQKWGNPDNYIKSWKK